MATDTSTCLTCGDEFNPIPEAWGASICGGCLAARLELELMRPLLGDGERKPMRRATWDQDVEVTVEPLRRRA